MVAELPEPARLSLAGTLAQWRQWSTPAPLTAAPRYQRLLASGQSNHSVLVATGDKRFVVRIDGVDPRRLGLNRAAEWRAQQQASARHLAPAPRYFNPELGSLVSDYLPPETVVEGERAPEPVARLLRAIHRLPPLRHRLDQPLAKQTGAVSFVYFCHDARYNTQMMALID